MQSAAPGGSPAMGDHKLHIARVAVHLCTELAGNMEESGSRAGLGVSVLSIAGPWLGCGTRSGKFGPLFF